MLFKLVRLLGMLALYGLVVFQVGSAAIGLLNQPRTTSVLAGVFLLVGIVGSFIAIVPAVLRYGQSAFKAYKKEIDMTRFNSFLLFLVATSVLGTSGCIGCTRIDAGHVGIVVNLAGDQRGVQDLPTQTGWVTYNPIGTSVFEYPTFVQTAVWTKSLTEGNPTNEEITFTNADQMQFAADISLAYQLQPEKVPAFYVKFRSDDLAKFTHGFLRNLAREKFDNVGGKYKTEQIMGDNAPFLAEVRKALQDELDPIGVHIEQFGFIGAPRPPQNVIDSINAKNAAMQKAMQVEGELRQTKAEAEKHIAAAEGQAKAEVAKAKGDAEARRIKADAEAYANQVVARSITPLVIEYWRTQKWNGQMPQVTSGNNSGLLYQLPSPSSK
ncbi:MAG: SPFH domain-containing protein [Candidatus Magasanikbacteria bacterium]|nr:SPFH domain-containing protein [Candidatus Magasanikbacteria bacterium]